MASLNASRMKSCARRFFLLILFVGMCPVIHSTERERVVREDASSSNDVQNPFRHIVKRQAVDPRLRGGEVDLPDIFPDFSHSTEEAGSRDFRKVLKTLNSDSNFRRVILIEDSSHKNLNSSKENHNKRDLPIVSADGDSDFLPLLIRSKEVNADGRRSAEEKNNVSTTQLGVSTFAESQNLTKAAPEKGDKSGEKRDDVGEIIDHILDKLDDDDDKGAGTFNETIKNQEGTMEWVARVGKHHHKSGPPAENGQSEDKNSQASSKEVKSGKNETKESPIPVEKDAQSHGEKKAESSFFNMAFGGGKKPDSVPKAENKTVANGQQSSQFKSEGEIKEMAEKQAKDKADKEEREKSENSELEDVPRLIDSNDNEYVISKPGKGSKMQLQEDFTLISDIVKVIVSAAIGALACGFMGQPLILGYLGAGMIVGPGGFRLIHELVQVETLAQFGVVFLLFALGIEFNLSKMQGCQAVALGGGVIQIFSMMLLGALFNTVITQGIFIGAFLSMSSTAVVLKCLMDANLGSTEHGQIMLGTLILQDCALGLLLAVLPALSSPHTSPFAIFQTLAHALLLLAAFCACAFVLAKLAVHRFLHHLLRLSKHSAELYQLGCVGLCLCLALVSESLGLSLEVGAFVAGLMLSGGKHSEKTLHQIEPIRNIFAALFLTSIGMVMNPEFLLKHIFILLSSLAVVFFGKAILIAATVRLFGYNASTAISVGIALSQIGEFSFVLLSRAQTLRLVSHKVYLLLMGTTALSLVLTPFSFKLVIWIIANEEKWRRRGSAGISLLSSNANNDQSDPESVVSPHVMTTHRDNETMRLRAKTVANSFDDDRESYDDDNKPGTGGKVTNGNKSLNSQSSRSSPRTPNNGKTFPSPKLQKSPSDDLTKYGQAGILEIGQQISQTLGVAAWQSSQESVGALAH